MAFPIRRITPQKRPTRVAPHVFTPTIPSQRYQQGGQLGGTPALRGAPWQGARVTTPNWPSTLVPIPQVPLPTLSQGVRRQATWLRPAPAIFGSSFTNSGANPILGRGVRREATRQILRSRRLVPPPFIPIPGSSSAALRGVVRDATRLRPRSRRFSSRLTSSGQTPIRHRGVSRTATVRILRSQIITSSTYKASKVFPQVSVVAKQLPPRRSRGLVFAPAFTNSEAIPLVNRGFKRRAPAVFIFSRKLVPPPFVAPLVGTTPLLLLVAKLPPPRRSRSLLFTPRFTNSGRVPSLVQGMRRKATQAILRARLVLVPAISASPAPVSRGVRRQATPRIPLSSTIQAPPFTNSKAAASSVVGVAREATRQILRSRFFRPSSPVIAVKPVLVAGVRRLATQVILRSRLLVSPAQTISPILRQGLRRKATAAILRSAAYAPAFTNSGTTPARLLQGVRRRATQAILRSRFASPRFTSGGVQPIVARGRLWAKVLRSNSHLVSSPTLTAVPSPTVVGVRRQATKLILRSRFYAPGFTNGGVFGVLVSGLRRIATRRLVKAQSFTPPRTIAITPVLFQGVRRQAPLRLPRAQRLAPPRTSGGITPQFTAALRALPPRRRPTRLLVPPFTHGGVAGVLVAGLRRLATRRLPKAQSFNPPSTIGIQGFVASGVRRLATRRLPRAQQFTPRFTNSGTQPSAPLRGAVWPPRTRKQQPPRSFSPPFTNGGASPALLSRGRFWARPTRPRGLPVVPPPFTNGRVQPPSALQGVRRLATQKILRSHAFNPVAPLAGQLVRGVRRLATQPILRTRGLAPRFTNSGTTPVLYSVPRAKPTKPHSPQVFAPPFTSSGVKPAQSRGAFWPPRSRKQSPPRSFAPGFTNSGSQPQLLQGVHRQATRQILRSQRLLSPPFTNSGARPATVASGARWAKVRRQPTQIITRRAPLAGSQHSGLRWAPVRTKPPQRFAPPPPPTGSGVTAKLSRGLLWAPVRHTLRHVSRPLGGPPSSTRYVFLLAHVRSATQLAANVRSGGRQAARLRDGKVLAAVRSGGVLIAQIDDGKAGGSLR